MWYGICMQFNKVSSQGWFSVTWFFNKCSSLVSKSHSSQGFLWEFPCQLLRWNHDLSSVSFDWKSVGFFRSESDKDKRLLWELNLFLWRIIWGLLVLIISTTISYARMPVQCSDTCHWISICFFRFPLRKKNLHYNNYIYFSFFLHELN